MNTAQIVFFKEIKSKISDNQSLVYDLSEILDISIDSSYRRIRGETPLAYNEIQLLCKHYNISFDSLCNIQSENIIFQYKSLVNASTDVFSCFQKIYKDLSFIEHCKKTRIITAANDIPSFHIFKYPELTSFRLHNWIFNMLKYENKKDLGNNIDFNSLIEHEELKETLGKIVKIYENTSSVEIWTTDTISGILKSIEFYFESFLFNDKHDLLILCNCLLDLMNNLFNKPENINIKLYISDIVIENNYVFIQADDLKFVYLKLYSLNNIMTTNKSFCSETEIWLNNLISKSTLVSGSSEKIRKIFYMNSTKRIKNLMARIERGY